MQPSIEIRIATVADAPKLLSIYTPYIEQTSITFEYIVPTIEEFESRIANTLLKYPYFVALIADEIVGYAYASTFKGRAAYDWSVETSIYVDQTKKGAGIGTSLYLALESTLQKQQVCNICACITYPNPGSIDFHTKFQYKQVAHFTKSGYKFNQWHDMIWMEKAINYHAIPPAPFVPFPMLS